MCRAQLMERMVVELPQRRQVLLSPQVTAPRRARDFLARSFAAWHAEQFTEPGQLVISELVTNAVGHSGTDIRVELERERRRLRLRVHDDGGGIPGVVPRGARECRGGRVSLDFRR